MEVSRKSSLDCFLPSKEPLLLIEQNAVYDSRDVKEMLKVRTGNRVLKKMFSSKRQEVTGEWRILHNGEGHDL
jgi:hypothetical protein